jgi:hypothetical protein
VILWRRRACRRRRWWHSRPLLAPVLKHRTCNRNCTCASGRNLHELSEPVGQEPARIVCTAGTPFSLEVHPCNAPEMLADRVDHESMRHGGWRSKHARDALPLPPDGSHDVSAAPSHLCCRPTRFCHFCCNLAAPPVCLYSTVSLFLCLETRSPARSVCFYHPTRLRAAATQPFLLRLLTHPFLE